MIDKDGNKLPYEGPVVGYYEDDQGIFYPVIDEGFMGEWSCCGQEDPYFFKVSCVPRYGKLKCHRCSPNKWRLLKY